MILVLTHVDQLNAKDKNTAKVFVNSIIKSTKAPRFAVLGNHEADFEDEHTTLSKFSCIVENSEEIQRGTSALNLQIEDKIASHLENQIPKLRKALEKELKDTSSRLEQIKEDDPSSLIVNFMADIQLKMKDSLLIINLEIRQIQEKYAKKIKDITIWDLDEDEDLRN